MKDFFLHDRKARSCRILVLAEENITNIDHEMELNWH